MSLGYHDSVPHIGLSATTCTSGKRWAPAFHSLKAKNWKQFKLGEQIPLDLLPQAKKLRHGIKIITISWSTAFKISQYHAKLHRCEIIWCVEFVLKYIKRYDEANYKKNCHYYKWVIDIWNPLDHPFYSLSMFEIFHKYKNGSEYNENIIINISYISFLMGVFPFQV